MSRKVCPICGTIMPIDANLCRCGQHLPSIAEPTDRFDAITVSDSREWYGMSKMLWLLVALPFIVTGCVLGIGSLQR